MRAHPLAAPLAAAGGRSAWYADIGIALGASGVHGWGGARVFDLGCGDGEFLQAIAEQGADVVGIEKASAPPSPLEDEITILKGDLAALTVGAPADVFVSRNTLKRGFIRPLDGTPARFSLGRSPQATLQAIAANVKSGGLFCIYNVSPSDPALAKEAHADGHCPYTQAELEAAGFIVLVHDRDATSLTVDCARQLANASLASGVHALVTICVRR